MDCHEFNELFDSSVPDVDFQSAEEEKSGLFSYPSALLPWIIALSVLTILCKLK